MTSFSVSFSAAAIGGFRTVRKHSIEPCDDGAGGLGAFLKAGCLGICLKGLHRIEPHDAKDFAPDEGARTAGKRNVKRHRRRINQPVGLAKTDCE